MIIFYGPLHSGRHFVLYLARNFEFCSCRIDGRDGDLHGSTHNTPGVSQRRATDVLKTVQHARKASRDREGHSQCDFGLRAHALTCAAYAFSACACVSLIKVSA